MDFAFQLTPDWAVQSWHFVCGGRGASWHAFTEYCSGHAGNHF